MRIQQLCTCSYLKNGERTLIYLNCFPSYSFLNPKGRESRIKLKRSFGQTLSKLRRQRWPIPTVLWSPWNYHVSAKANGDIRAACKSTLFATAYTYYCIWHPFPSQNATRVICIATFSKTYINLIVSIAKTSGKRNVLRSIFWITKLPPIYCETRGVITWLS